MENLIIQIIIGVGLFSLGYGICWAILSSKIKRLTAELEDERTPITIGYIKQYPFTPEECIAKI